MQLQPCSEKSVIQQIHTTHRGTRSHWIPRWGSHVIPVCTAQIVTTTPPNPHLHRHPTKRHHPNAPMFPHISSTNPSSRSLRVLRSLRLRRRSLCVGFRLGPRLSLQSPFPSSRVNHAHARQLLVDFLLLERDLVGLFRGGPEAGHAETVVEIRSEVIHPADGEDDVHAELEGLAG